MNATIKNIERYFEVIDRSLFLITGTLDYDRVTDALIKLANTIHALDTVGDGCGSDHDSDALWAIGEFGNCSLPDLIVGAYWHCTEWHAGQWSQSYAALCALGQVFQPGMTSVEPDNDAYLALETMAIENNDKVTT